MIKLGTGNIADVKIGTNQIASVMLGNNSIWENCKTVSGVPPITITNAKEGNATDYKIYGASGGVGNKSNNIISIPNQEGTISDAYSNVYVSSKNGEIAVRGHTRPGVFTIISLFHEFYLAITSGKPPLISEEVVIPANTDFYVGINSDEVEAPAYIIIQYDDGTHIAGGYNNVIRASKNIVNIWIRYGQSLDLNTTLRVWVTLGNAKTSFEPYGYKIPVSCGTNTTNIYTEQPLDENDYIDYKNQKAVIGGVETSKVLPPIALSQGTNTVSIGTTVTPSNMIIKYR